MSEIVNGTKLSLRLKSEIANAKDVRLAVAFWGGGAADRLGITADNAKCVKIVCNLQSGGTNPAEISELQKRGAEVRQLNDLHAKIGVMDGFSFVGSSNMSTNGLSEEEDVTGWREANVIYGDRRAGINQLFDEYWNCASEITEQDLSQAKLAWLIRCKASAQVSTHASNLGLVSILRRNPSLLDHLNVRMVVSDEITDPEELEVLEGAQTKASSQYGDLFDVYWGWEGIAELSDAYLVDFCRFSNGRLKHEGLYRRNSKEFKDFDENNESYQVVYKVDDIEGIQFLPADTAAVLKAFRAFLDAGNVGENGKRKDDFNFPISELAKYLPKEA